MKELIILAGLVYALLLGLVMVCLFLAMVRTIFLQIARLRAFRLKPGHLSPWCEWCEETDCEVSFDGTCKQIRRYHRAVFGVDEDGRLVRG